MEFGSFYGLTAPQLIMSGVSINKFQRAISLLNNANDYIKLKSLLSEFSILDKFIDEKIDYTYKNAQDTKLQRKVKLSTDHYETGASISPRQLLSPEELEEAKKYLLTCEKQMLPQIKVPGNVIRLSNEERIILEYFVKKRNAIKRYSKCVKINTFNEVSVFGVKLYKLIDACKDSGDYFKSVVVAVLWDLNKNKNKDLVTRFYNECKEDLNQMKECLQEPDDDEFSNVNKHNITFVNGVITSMPPFLNKKDEPLIKLLRNKGLLDLLNLKDLKTISELYAFVTLFDVDFYNIEFGLELTQEQYSEIFKKLDSLGFIGLNFFTKDFFSNMLDSVFLTTSKKLYISPSSNLAYAMTEVDRLLNTKMNYGEELK